MTTDHLLAELRASCALADQANDNTKTANAYLSLSQTQRRLAHLYRADAMKYEAEGNHRNYAACMTEARRLWNDAKWHLERAKLNYERSHR